MRVLIQLGGDPTLNGTWLDYTGSPLDFARQYKHREIMDIFSGGDGKLQGAGGARSAASMSRASEYILAFGQNIGIFESRYASL